MKLWVCSVVFAALACSDAALGQSVSSNPQRVGGLAVERLEIRKTTLDFIARYRIRNSTAEHVQLPVQVMVQDLDPADILLDRPVFKLAVAGHDILPSVRPMAVLPDGRDISEDLERLGGDCGTLQSGWIGFRETTASGNCGRFTLITLEQFTELERIGAIRDGRRLWRNAALFSWEQAFPPGITILEQRLRREGWNEIRIPARDEEERDTVFREYCFSDSQVTALRRTQELVPPSLRLHYNRAAAERVQISLGLARAIGGRVGQLVISLNMELWSRSEYVPTKAGAVLATCSPLPFQQRARGLFDARIDTFDPANDLDMIVAWHQGYKRR